jgi:hypothetical protein
MGLFGKIWNTDEKLASRSPIPLGKHNLQRIGPVHPLQIMITIPTGSFTVKYA